MRLPLGGYSPDTLLSAPKHEPLELTLRSSGQKLQLAKAPGESVEHLVLKGLLWALLLQTHPSACFCEKDLGLRYRPDVVAFDEGNQISWWGECGSVKASKLNDLMEAFPNARISVAKWGRSDLRGYASNLRSELNVPADGRAVPFELISFPADSIDRFIAADGELTVAFNDLQVVPLIEDEPPPRRGPRARLS